MTTYECGLEVTHCDDCGADLEEGQVGQCEDCLPPKEYTFAELSEEAKDKARDALRYTDHYLDHDWWDGVYYDAVRVATILGLDIMATERRNGKLRQVPAINFSGFCSQGDGACFQGSYQFNPKAVDEMKAHCNDEELIRIATGLYTLQVARRLHGLEPFTAMVNTSGRYSHSGTMDVVVNAYDADGNDDEGLGDLDDTVTQLIRDFADWIYARLEQEHDYLMSDEVVDEQLTEEIFDEDGSVI